MRWTYKLLNLAAFDGVLILMYLQIFNTCQYSAWCFYFPWLDMCM